ncbi:hypothetical protein MAFF211471_00760 [Ralstonia solanacearum]|nr:hypothetical protein MAFF211471_00760 [Ralstonia solanacearum]BCM97539.1 hypothetical protein RPSA_00760 [Ralstonia solanacearum]
MPLGAAEAALGSSLPPQAVSDSDNQAASGNAADDNGRTCMDFSLNVFLCVRMARHAGTIVCATRENGGLGRGSAPTSIGRRRDAPVTTL